MVCRHTRVRRNLGTEKQQKATGLTYLRRVDRGLLLKFCQSEMAFFIQMKNKLLSKNILVVNGQGKKILNLSTPSEILSPKQLVYELCMIKRLTLNNKMCLSVIKM